VLSGSAVVAHWVETGAGLGLRATRRGVARHEPFRQGGDTRARLTPPTSTAHPNATSCHACQHRPDICVLHRGKHSSAWHYSAEGRARVRFDGLRRSHRCTNVPYSSYDRLSPGRRQDRLGKCKKLGKIEKPFLFGREESAKVDSVAVVNIAANASR
jgi:hypothetical protein